MNSGAIRNLLLMLLAASALAATADAQTTTLAAPGTQIAAGDVIRGNNGEGLVAFTLQRTSGGGGGGLNFTDITFTNSGTAGSGDFTNYNLHRDSNFNGTWDPGTDAIVASSTSTSITGFSEAIFGFAARTYFISVDIPGSATLGNTFVIDIASTGITMSSGTVTGSVSGNTQTIATPTGPEIDVQRPAGTANSIASGGTDDLGNVTIGTTTQFTYTIENLGTTDLTLQTATPVTIGGGIQFGLNSATVNTQPTSPVSASSSTTFIIDVNPSQVAFQFQLNIDNDDTTGNEDPYIITVTGTGVTAAPEMDVQRPVGTANSIADGGTDSVGTIPTGSASNFTWTIENTGTADLNLTGTPLVAISAQNNCTATVTTSPTTPVGSSGGTTTFSIDITPTAAGAFDFVVSIDNNDSDENPYNFTVDGSGQASTATDLVIATGGQPGGGTGGIAWASQPVVEAHDSGGIDTTYTGAVTAAITTGTGTTGASLLGTVTVNCVAGVATFTDLAIDLAGTGYTLDFTSGSLNPVTSNTFDITVGPAAQLVITTPPGNGTGGLALSTQPVLEVQDAGGNLLTSDNSTVVNAAITTGTGTTGAQIVAGGSATASGGVVTFAGLAIDLAGTNYTLDFTDGSLPTVTSAQFDVTVGAAAALRIATQPGGASENTAFVTQPVIEIVDAGGNVVTSDSTTQVSAAITTGTGTTGATLTSPGTNNPATAASGVVSFTDLEIDLAGTGYTLDFQDTGATFTTVTSDPFNVAGVPAQLGMVTQPGGAVANQQFVTQPEVEIQDSTGTRVTSDNSTQVVVTISAGTGAFTGGSTTTVTAVNGLVSFIDLGIDTAGLGFTLQFDDVGATLTNVTSASFDVAGPATQLVIVTQPSGAAPATAFTQQPVIEIQDANGVLVATDNTTQVDASITSGTGAMGAVLGGTTSVTAVNGVVTFTDLSIDLEGSAYTLDFADASTTLPTVTSAAFDVTAGSSGGGGGGGGDDDEGCSTGSSNGWFMLAGLLALLALATRLRTRES